MFSVGWWLGGDKIHFYDTHDTILLTTQMVTLVLGKRIAAKILSFFCSFQEDLEAVDEPDWTLTDWRWICLDPRSAPFPPTNWNDLTEYEDGDNQWSFPPSATPHWWDPGYPGASSWSWDRKCSRWSPWTRRCSWCRASSLGNMHWPCWRCE